VQGREANRALLAQPELFANKLAALCRSFGFDGWLVNIESAVTSMAEAAAFVAALTCACKAHLGPESIVLYYDSLDTHG